VALHSRTPERCSDSLTAGSSTGLIQPRRTRLAEGTRPPRAWVRRRSRPVASELQTPQDMLTNTLIRSEPCRDCGAEVLWTQNAWQVDGRVGAAYRCTNGHVIDPALTRQCPDCGVHDTVRIAVLEDNKQQCRCLRCDKTFEAPQ
jgi:hypothetical protein